MSKYRDYITCHMVCGVISDWYYIFDDGIDSQALKRSQSWRDQHEDAAGWLLDEAYRSIEDVGETDSAGRMPVRRIDYESDQLTFYAADKIAAAATSITSKDLSYDEVRLFYYMGWLNKVLLYMTQTDGADPLQSERFVAAEPLLQLQRLLVAEIQKLENLGIELLNESVDQISQELFERWKFQVIAMTQNG